MDKDKDIKISGYASLFDVEDISGDVVREGAFKKTLEDGSMPMLFAHKPGTPIGVWETVREDEAGLFVEGIIRPSSSPQAKKLADLIKGGSVTGLSIGYRTVKSSPRVRGRNLLELDLWEVSVVGFPLLRAARIQDVE